MCSADIYLMKDADACQQQFSSDRYPSLYHAIPALEQLYHEWDRRSQQLKYFDFAAALDKGKKKIDEYYKRTESGAYTFAMCK